MATISSLAVAVTANTAGLQENLNKAQKHVEGFGHKVRDIAADMASSKLAAIGFGNSVMGVLEGLEERGKETARQLERLGVQLGFLIGDAEAGKHAVESLEAAALGLKVNPEQFIEAGRGLLKFRIPAEDVISTLTALENISAATSSSMEEMVSVVGRASVVGSVNERTLRKLISGMPAVYDELRTMAGVSKDEFKAMAQNGEISFGMLKKAIENVGFGEYGNAAKMMGETAAGSFDHMKNSITALAAAITKTGPVQDFFFHVARGANMVRNALSGKQSLMSAIKFGMDESVDPLHGHAKHVQEDAEEMERATKPARDLASQLRMQADTFGMSSGAAKLYELSIKGIGEKELWAARLANSQLESLQRKKKAHEDAKSVIDSLRSPMQKFIDDEQKLLNLNLAGAITTKQLEQARAKLQEEMDRNSPAGKLAEDVAKTTEDLERQVRLFGKSHTEAAILELKLKGASEEQLKAARAAAEQLENMQGLADLDEEMARQDEDKKNATRDVGGFAGAVLSGSRDAYSAIISSQRQTSMPEDMKAIRESEKKQEKIQQESLEAARELTREFKRRNTVSIN